MRRGDRDARPLDDRMASCRAAMEALARLDGFRVVGSFVLLPLDAGRGRVGKQDARDGADGTGRVHSPRWK